MDSFTFDKPTDNTIEVVSDDSSEEEAAVPLKKTAKVDKVDKVDRVPYGMDVFMNRDKTQVEEEEEEYTEEEESEDDFEDEESIIAHRVAPDATHQSHHGESFSHHDTHHDTESEKQDLYLKLLQLQARGATLSKKYNSNSDYYEIKAEYKRQEKLAAEEAAVAFSKKALLACVTGIEWLNKKFDPVGAKLDGWSETVMENQDDYDQTFVKLYEKYNSDVDMAPEFDLIFKVAGSAFMYHLTSSLFKKSAFTIPQPSMPHGAPFGVPPAQPAPQAPQAPPAPSVPGPSVPGPSSRREMSGPSITSIPGLPNFAEMMKKGPPKTAPSRPSMPVINDNDRFSVGSDSDAASEVKSITIKRGNKNQLVIG